MDEYVEKYGAPGFHFACYHQLNDKSNIIRLKEPDNIHVQKIVWPSVFLVLGTGLSIHAVYRKRLTGEGIVKTYLIVLGLGSYLDLRERFIAHYKSRRVSPVEVAQETNADSPV